VEPVTLKTERLTLRPFAADDVDAVHLACQDPDIQFFTPAPSPFARTETTSLAPSAGTAEISSAPTV
jgi:RimJ/RimL family protein N-acetyltransferase